MSKNHLRFGSFFLVVRCAFSRLLRGKAEKVVEKPRTIAVANFTTNLGDMIMATPVFRAIKAAHPGCRVIVIGGGKNGELLAGNKDIDHYISASDFSSALAEVRKEKPDMGVALNPSPQEVALLYLGGCRGIATFIHEGFGSRAFRALSSLVLNVSWKTGEYVPLQNLKLLAALGIRSSDTVKYLAVDPATVSKVKAHIGAKGPLLVVSPDAGQDYREWPLERFAAVAAHARTAYGASIAFAGGPNAKEMCRRFTELCGAPVFDGTGQTIEELKALVSFATAVVSNDSGIAYIAEAFGIPAVIVAGVADPKEHPQGSSRAEVIVPQRMEYVLHAKVSDVSMVDSEEARSQMASIPVGAVLDAVDKVFKKRG